MSEEEATLRIKTRANTKHVEPVEKKAKISDEKEEKEIIQILPFGSNMQFVFANSKVLYNSYILPKIDFWNKLLESESNKKISDTIKFTCTSWNDKALCHLLLEYAKNAHIEPIYKAEKITFFMIFDLYKILVQIGDVEYRKKLLQVVTIDPNVVTYTTNNSIITEALGIYKLEPDGKVIKTQDTPSIPIKIFRETQKTDLKYLDHLAILRGVEPDVKLKDYISIIIAVIIYYSDVDCEHYKYMNQLTFMWYRKIENSLM
jgi:hypothetical protein